ncbi:hypothetical protein SASPL_133988 [Salvia splendens]|uniref:non-specific serine/threonine protein kinase n=1 Tax=Salvia splendens TaxID=180675 RepID=A0A8X8X430_SALSN|nr:hypothetical protein SASPL_133988 [Salvia splendens]
MVLQVRDRIEVRVQIKIVSAMCTGAVVAEAKGNAANWVILDKTRMAKGSNQLHTLFHILKLIGFASCIQLFELKQEIKQCVDELRCNIVVMKNSQPNVLRLNLTSPNDTQTPFYTPASFPIRDSKKLQSQSVKHMARVSSRDDPNASSSRMSTKNISSTPDIASSVYIVCENNPLYQGLSKGTYPPNRVIAHNAESETSLSPRFLIAQNDENGSDLGNTDVMSRSTYTLARTETGAYSDEGIENSQISDGDHAYNSSIREAVSFRATSPIPPPLCVISEGRFGLVHRGVLRNGLVIAVKQLKFAGPERDADFCREVCVLSCAQHRNVVLLIGFCIQGKKRLLVYEYICNRSLDFHLHGRGNPVLDWQARLKIAIGTARGLRYLHEDCRVGCIIHRNLRPSKILLTHDFEPLQVADFGLARLHDEWESCESSQIVGASWYLAPELVRGGKMTEKVDVYAFGLVLLELITGQQAHDLQYCSDNQFLLDHIRALAAGNGIRGLIVSSTRSRPPTTHVVKMLEGGSPASCREFKCVIGIHFFFLGEF